MQSNWEKLVEWLSKFFDKPIAIIIATIIVVGVFILIIISKTSYGKGAIRHIKSELTATKEILAKKLQKVVEKEKDIEKLRLEIEHHLSEKDKEIAELKEYIQELCKLIPNARVKQLGCKIAEIKHEEESKGE